MIIDITQIPVYYINLDSSDERREAISSALRQAGFTNVIRFKASTGVDSVHGCAKSHHALMSLVKHSGPFLVLEDDVDLTKDFTPIIEIPDNADAIYLGTTISGREKGVSINLPIMQKKNDDYYQAYNLLSAHAILYVNENYVQFLRKALNLSLQFQSHQDIVRADSMKFFTVYVRNKPMFYQNDLESGTNSVTKNSVDYLRTQTPDINNLGLYCKCSKHKVK